MPNLFDAILGTSWEKALYKEAAKRGRAEGAHGRPAGDTPKYDVGETHLRGEVEKKLIDVEVRLADELQKVLPTITKKGSDLSQLQLTFEARTAPDDVARAFEGLIANKRSALESAQFRKHEAEGNYNRFRLENNVTIDPDHPSDRLNYLSVVFVLLAVESVLNAFFWGQKFGENFSLGLLIALAVSAFNILVGFVGGIALTYRNLASRRSKIVGLLGFLAAFAVAAGVNWWVIMQRGGGAAGPSASIINAVMFCVGLSFSMVAAYKGYRFFGSIPGYEAASAAYLAAVAQTHQIEGELRQAASNEVVAQSDLRNGALRTIGDVKVYFAKVRAELQHLHAHFKIASHQLSGVLEHVVNAYRANNKATKGAMTPSPSWFDDPIERYPEEARSLNEAIRTVDEVAGRADLLANGLLADSREEIAALEAIKIGFHGERLPAFVETCNRAGHKRFIDSLAAVGNKGRGGDPS